MEDKEKELVLRFQEKGFLPMEISGLIKDVAVILDRRRYFTRIEISRELEDLGWGIDIIDVMTYDLIKSSDQ